MFTGGCNLRCPFCHNAGLVRTPLASDNLYGEVLAYLKSRRGVLEGVCVTGGEPLLQPDLIPFLKEIKDMGFKVKLDTNGSLPQKLKEVLDLGIVDYVAMDIKSSEMGYATACGGDVDFAVFKNSMQVIRDSGVKYEFRTTAVKGIHQISDFTEIAKMLAPNENYFIQGFIDSGNLLGTGSAFTAEEMQNILKEVHKFVPKALLRGQQ